MSELFSTQNHTDRIYSILTKISSKELDFEDTGEQKIIYMLFGGSKSKPQIHREYQISMKNLDDSYSCNFIALSQSMICQNVPAVSKEPWIQELQQDGIQLSDIDTRDEPIAVLIGADIAGKLMTGIRKELKSGPLP